MSVHHHINMLPVPDTQYCKCWSLVLIFTIYSPPVMLDLPSLAPTQHAAARRSIRDPSGGTWWAKWQQRLPRDGATGQSCKLQNCWEMCAESASDGQEQQPHKWKTNVSRLGKSSLLVPLFWEVCPVPSKGKQRATNTRVLRRGAGSSCCGFLAD